MMSLSALSGHYIDTWKDKEPPLDPDEKNPEIIAKKTAHLKSVNDAVYLAYAMAQAAETGFQKQKESYRFTDGAEEEPKEDYTTLADKMSGLVDKLENAEKNVHFGSKEYDNMKQYAIFVRDQLKEMAQTPAPAEPEQAEALQDERFERTQTMMSTMQALSEMYLQHRDSKEDAAPSTKTQKRIVAASELKVFAKSNCEKFSEPSFDEMYRDGLEQERENAFAKMKPKQIGTYIKNTMKVAREHPNEPNLIKQAHAALSEYLNLVKDQTPRKVGLNKKIVQDIAEFNQGVTSRKQKKTGTVQKTEKIGELVGDEIKETYPHNDSLNSTNSKKKQHTRSDGFMP